MKRNPLRAALAATSVLILTACGGGGSSSSANTTLSGVLVDSPVGGVTYTTPTLSGVTDSAGTFEYEPGETVTFSLGPVELGSATGADEVTLFDLAGVTSIPTTVKELDEALYLQPSYQPGPLNKVLNLAILLQTLDRDNNPENGIDIPTEVVSLIDTTLDLNDSYWEFANGGNGRDGRGLPGILYAAAEASILSPRPPVAPALALEHVWNEAGLTLSALRATRFTSDRTGDGIPETIREITFNSIGDTTLDTRDNNADGSIDETYSYAYNSNLQRTQYQADRNGDGNADETYQYQFDDFGRRTSYERIDDSGNVTTRETLTYDLGGNLIRRSVGITNPQIEHWIVDSDGMRSTYEVDIDGDGNIDRRGTLSFDGQTRGDRWTRNEIDQDLDGTPDDLRTRSFDARGNLLGEAHDYDMDGTVDYATRYTYDSNGLTTYYERERNQALEYSATTQRDAQGYPIEELRDQDGDGTADERIVTTYDSDYNRTSISWFNAGATQPRAIYHYVFDAAGNQTQLNIDANGDGQIDNNRTYTYNTLNQLVEWSYDRDLDGQPEETHTNENFVETGFGSLF